MQRIGQVGGMPSPWDFAIDPTGKFLFVASAGNSIRGFRIADNGQLTAAGTATPAESPHSVVVLIL
jgi:6-phosphogluconolactonase (cycloisomerase 2 family)